MTNNYHDVVEASTPASPDEMNDRLGGLDAGITANAAAIAAMDFEYSAVATEYLNGTGEFTVPAGTGASIDGHVIQDEGVDMTQRAKIDFKGDLVAVTNGVSATEVNVALQNDLSPALGGNLDVADHKIVTTEDNVTVELETGQTLIVKNATSTVFTVDENGNVVAAGSLLFAPTSETVQLSSGVATITNRFATLVVLQVETGGSPDSCDRIVPHADWQDGYEIVVCAYDSADDVILEQNSGSGDGKLYLAGAVDFTLDNARDAVRLILRTFSGVKAWFSSAPPCNNAV